ncbi:alpha/beta hydrolase-fold protein [Streptomyces sp. MST-110588]|uniref:alpha/beta hydrolase n=1 Tax=Streptomyces sp. MST-110588 TaxID=2833628 RepID=UPI001F5E0D3D|nr:alpha/beta hydrolase-fold protein [Streptomyces sp. MST-110588]
MRKNIRSGVASLIALAALACTAGCSTEDAPKAPVRFGDSPGTASRKAAPPGKRSLALMPTHPISFKEQRRVGGAGGNTPIGVTTYRGPKSGFTGKVWVWAPPEYYEKRNADKGFPVMVALPGGPGYPVNYWIGADLKLEENLARWSKEGKSLPFIVVMPVLNPDARQYYDGSDIPGQPKIGTWLSQDVPDLVRANFRTLNTRKGWAMMGSSSGGFVSLKNALQYPDKFAVAIPNGPDIVPDSPLWNGHARQQRENNPEVLAQRLIRKGGPEVYLAFQDGTGEGTVLPKVRKFLARYGRGPVRTRLQLVPGGTHSAHTYVEGMGLGTIQWVSAHMQGPAA